VKASPHISAQINGNSPSAANASGGPDFVMPEFAKVELQMTAQVEIDAEMSSDTGDYATSPQDTPTSPEEALTSPPVLMTDIMPDDSTAPSLLAFFATITPSEPNRTASGTAAELSTPMSGTATPAPTGMPQTIMQDDVLGHQRQ
jgi:hypothetical protein